MNLSLFLILLFLLVGINYLIIFYLISKINRLNKFIYKNNLNELPLIIEQLKELIIESERVSENLDTEITRKENLLEDLSVLVDEKLNKYASITSTNKEEKKLSEKIKDLYNKGLSPIEIAKELCVSVTEVNLVIKMKQ
ncbi:hypothetical protein LF845_06360 [Deferribacterales bacterium Es71-Z0220]|jgi:hypothetical protein|uniref:DUF6115 domain-containing protein n=1 Tax=Deferrivibrio essentukiensis TaxID=2880922 RepID=UPI001F6063E7|nr:hypothetical protein [Deferrivibrio essentukiensis]MBZ4672625.1 hypothetical protein [Deferribacteraceae bacterium]MCB4204579.1 hypothetical protein [Deferrivibrio essentukiensis]